MSFRLVDSIQSVRRLARSIASSIAKETFRLALLARAYIFLFLNLGQPVNLVCLSVVLPCLVLDLVVELAVESVMSSVENLPSSSGIGGRGRPLSASESLDLASRT